MTLLIASSTTKDRLLQAAMAKFAVRGVRGTTMATISEAAEANIGTINHHFVDKGAFCLQAIRGETAATCK